MVTEQRDRRVNEREPTREGRNRRLPHERDEAPEGQVSPRGVMEQAADDLEQGLVDTDLHGERGIDQAVTPHGDGVARPNPRAGEGMRHQERK